MALVRAEVDIDAPAEAIWEILTDLGSYAEWNPFTPRVESTLELGSPVHLHARLNREVLEHRVEIVSAVEPGRRLYWGMQMGPRWLLAAERRQVLQPLTTDRTHYINEDEITGLLTPLVMRFYGAAMRRGFRDAADALKKRAETQTESSP